MKKRVGWMGVLLVSWMFHLRVAPADVVVQSIDAHGKITFSEMDGATEYRIEWSSSAGGAWTSFAAAASSLDSISPSGVGVMTALVPMVYRVVARATNQPPSGNMIFIMGGTLPDIGNGTLNVGSIYMGATEVTLGEWRDVYAWALQNDYAFDHPGEGCSDNHPVHTVSWFDCVKWCNAKSQMEGRSAVYMVNGAVFKSGISDPVIDPDANGYRLPLEDEWEFCARGGMLSQHFEYSGGNSPEEVAWYRANSAGAACGYFMSRGTWPVRQKRANELGLYDMSGNVWEWSEDYELAGSTRALRGGSWSLDAYASRVAYRSGTDPHTATSDLGFRVAVGAAPTPMPDSMVQVSGGTLHDIGNGELNVGSFFMSRFEVTLDQWTAVYSWAITNGYSFDHAGSGCASNHPVHTINWYDCLKWCNAKSQMEKRVPAYVIGNSIYKRGQSIPHVNYNANGYRLPLEDEWEFAARGGVLSQGYEYSGGSTIGLVAWYRDNSDGAACSYKMGKGTWPVGRKAANELGLHDMSGNVWEWSPEYELEGPGRALRGGSWSLQASACRVDFRSGTAPTTATDDLGFRVMLPTDR